MIILSLLIIAAGLSIGGIYYYTPQRPGKRVPLPEYIRYKMDYNFGRIYVRRILNIWFYGLLVMTFLLVGPWAFILLFLYHVIKARLEPENENPWRHRNGGA
jgi:hypothetical protein